MITEDDWIRPLVLLRDIATETGVKLTEAEEQAICRQATEAITVAMCEACEARVGDPSTPRPFVVRDFL